ncbi:unnamed protein product [Nippostrongylus brasiliensis]|uniref:Cholesterol desaturase daf-36 (inferred by orthology to a C. elegans protein) n=1 Tax=Nippostrongylus brasiliensis TaxID=27835 RepID=A0A0N4YSE3_NIPBR|nr:unnamed protein product [Nippostrongylus brasiliensis]
MTFILISVALATLAVLLYYALRPCNRIRKLGDLGLLLGDPELKGVYRERQITRLARLRRHGELPPVFPNGWYCIAESSELKPKSVKEVTVLGNNLFNINLDNEKPLIRHVWDGKWAPRTGDEAHISVMHLDQYMTIGGYKIPLTSSRLRAEQVRRYFIVDQQQRWWGRVVQWYKALLSPARSSDRSRPGLTKPSIPPGTGRLVPNLFSMLLLHSDFYCVL